MGKEFEIRWLAEPEQQDYPAAESYLTLLFPALAARQFVKKLKKAPLSRFKAKDIFRASGLSLLGISNSHVQKDQRKVESGKKVSPLLLVRDSQRGRLIVADGYHRLCATYSFNEDALIPCKIV